MVKIVVLALFGLTILLAAGLIRNKKSGSQKTLSDEAHALVESGAILLDVRTRGEYAAGSLKGSINIPVDELEARMSEVPKGKQIVTYCRSGRRSAAATVLLEKAGFKVFDLQSISNWETK